MAEFGPADQIVKLSIHHFTIQRISLRLLHYLDDLWKTGQGRRHFFKERKACRGCFTFSICLLCYVYFYLSLDSGKFLYLLTQFFNTCFYLFIYCLLVFIHHIDHHGRSYRFCTSILNLRLYVYFFVGQPDILMVIRCEE